MKSFVEHVLGKRNLCCGVSVGGASWDIKGHELGLELELWTEAEPPHQRKLYELRPPATEEAVLAAFKAASQVAEQWEMAGGR
jgi:hypothetical protein